MQSSSPAPDVAGLILAGGASSRMGRNKALLAWDGEPLVARVHRALAAVAPQCAVIANDPEPYRFLNLPIFPDRQPGHGPLMGLYSGLMAIQAELAVVVAVDMPFLSPDLLRYLISLVPGHDVVIPQAQGRLHPLCAVYRRSACAPAIAQTLASGKRRLIAFHDQVRVQIVPEQAVARFSPDFRALMNVNTPAELAAARRLQDPMR